MEWLLANQFCNPPAANTLSTDQHGFILTTWKGHPYALEVWFEFSPCDSGDLRTNAAEVFLLTTDGNGVPHRESFSAAFTVTRHRTTFFLIKTLSGRSSHDTGDAGSRKMSHAGWYQYIFDDDFWVICLEWRRGRAVSAGPRACFRWSRFHLRHQYHSSPSSQ